MAVYCESRSDMEVLDEIGDAKRILLVGCPSCANMSLALRKELPMYKLTLGGIKAVCTADEMERIADLIAQKGIRVSSWLPSFPTGLCVLAEGARKKLASKCQDVDTVIAFSCETGTEYAEGILKGKNVVGAMNAKGLVSATTKRKMGKADIDKETVRIKRFVFE